MAEGNALTACRSAAEIAAAVGAGDSTALAETDGALARIKERDGAVRAWRWLDPEIARAAANAVDAAAVEACMWRLLNGAAPTFAALGPVAELPALETLAARLA